MKNRIITYITAIMMIISMPSVFADSESSPAVNPSFVRDLEFINMLGIADETDTSDAHRIVTRAEFTHLIVNMLNFSHIQNQKDLFADVGSSSKYADAIYSALELGIVSGTGDSYFRPDDAITYDAAIKMTVSALGKSCMKDKAAVSRAVAKLEEKGLVQRNCTGNNIYRAPIVLTEKGREVSRYVAERASEVVEIAGLGEADRESFYIALNTIAENLSKMSEGGLPEQ